VNNLREEIKRLKRLLAEQVYTDERTVMLLTDEIISIQEALYDTTRTTEDRSKN
jgi:hypothetical protein